MWKQTFRLQFHTMIHKRSFFFMLLIVSILTAYFSLKMVWGFNGMDRASLFPAWFMWNHNQLISYTSVSPGMDYLDLLGLSSLLLIPLLGPMAYGDSYYDHLKNGTLIGILTRSTRRDYYTTGALVSFIGSAMVFLIPFLMEQLLLLILCAGAPQQNAAAYSPLSDAWGYFAGVPAFLWPFQIAHPYLYNLVVCFFIVVLGGSFSVLCYTISLYFHRNRFLVITLPGILMWIGYDYVSGITFSMGNLVPSLPQVIQLSDEFCYFLLPICSTLLLFVSFLLIRHKCRKVKDILA